MAVVNGYCTTAELRTHLGDSGSALTTELLERAINSTSRAIDRYCQRRFWQDAAVAVRTYTCNDALEVYVDDISTRTGLVVKTGTDGATFGTTWASTDYSLEPRNADVVGSGSTADPYAFWKLVAIAGRSFNVMGSRPTLQVTARFGWSAVPYEVNEAAVLKAASLFKRKDSPNGVAGFGEFGVVRIGKNDPDVVELLTPFKVPVA
jgi:hypothetical protein